MDYRLSNNVNVYKEHQPLHVQAWQSATEAKLAAGRKLIAALQQNQDSRPSTSILPPDYDHHPQYEADPLVFLPNRPNSTENSMHGASLERARDAQPDDVVFYVGKRRQTFHLNAHTLISASAYFKHLLQHSQSPLPLAAADDQASYGCDGRFARPPIVIDCEEVIFEGLLLLMRYGTLEALPPMSAAEIFRLKKEAQFYGIHYMEPPSKSRAAESGDDCSDMSSIRSQSSSATDSPKSTMNMSPPVAYKGAGRTHEGVRIACRTSRRLAELPDFPPELADPARLVLVSCLDQDKASIYTCGCITTTSRQAAGSRMQWALNFHHRYAFCTSCGHPPNVSPKHFTNMFMAAAAAYYSSSGQTEPVEPNCAWWVSSDSTCMIRFISSAGDGADACGCSAGGARAGKEAPPTIWAANCFFSHAFCTSCAQAAKGPVLLSLLLALRYGGSNKVSKCARSSFTIPS